MQITIKKVFEKDGALRVHTECEYGTDDLGLSLQAKYKDRDGEYKWKKEVHKLLHDKYLATPPQEIEYPEFKDTTMDLSQPITIPMDLKDRDNDLLKQTLADLNISQPHIDLIATEFEGLQALRKAVRRDLLTLPESVKKKLKDNYNELEVNPVFKKIKGGNV